MAIDLTAVERIATDQASLKAAAGLARPAKWSGIGSSEDAVLIWGECAGSGANPYRVMADLRDMGSKCTCPSRKFPCKHALALLWMNAEALALFPPAPTPEWVSEWLGRRRSPVAKRPDEKPAPSLSADKNLAAARLAEPEPAAAPVAEAAAIARREAAAARRAEDSERAIGEALDALEQWVRDQLRLGLGGLIDDLTARCRRIAARLVDGKAATLAGHIDELPARLLALPQGERVRGATVELARLLLLARAWRAAPHDPELRRAVATAEPRESLLADPAALRLTARWEAIAEQVHTRRDGLIAQTTWLLNLQPTPQAPRFAMLLDFFPASTGRRGSAFAPGEQFAAELAFYPARAPLRALLIRRETAEAEALPWPSEARPLEERLTAPFLAEPWAVRHPVLLPPGRIGFDRAGRSWWRQDEGDTILPLAPASAGEPAGLICGTALQSAAALWSGSRLELLAAQTPWGRISHD